MKTRRAYCSACDRNVPVLHPSGASERGGSSSQDAAGLLCLDYGIRCTGALCPLFAVPTPEEWERLHGSGGTLR